MPPRACLDAGPIYLYYRKFPPKKVEALIQNIQEQKISAFVPSIILVEVFKHLCVTEGKDHAINCIINFQYDINAQFIALTPDLILDAGRLKCQYRTKLSYNDCIAIAVAIKLKAKLHTTEKNLPKIRNLRVELYNF